MPLLVHVLRDLAEASRRTTDLDTLLRATTRAAASLTGSCQSSLRLLDETRTRLLVAARSGPPVNGRGAGRFGATQGFQGWVVEHGEAAICNDPQHDPRFEKRAGQRWMPTALGGAPLKGRDGVIGVLGVVRDDDQDYQGLDLDLLGLVANLVLPQLEVRRVERLALTDALTLLLNRRSFDETLADALDGARRRRAPFSVLLLDLDHFGWLNNTHGHSVGDEVLVEVALRLGAAARLGDPVFRWGGEEFVVLLSGAGREEALRVAERIREGLADTPFATARGEIDVRGSLGVATLQASDTPRSLFDRMDGALDHAKRSGRSGVEFL